MISSMRDQPAAELLVVSLPMFQAVSTLLAVTMFALFGMFINGRRYKASMERLVQRMRQEQEQLKQSERAAKEFSANVSHEVQTSLASIQSFAEILLPQNVGLQQQMHYVEMIRVETMQLSAFTNQLLLLSQLEHRDRAVTRRLYDVKKQLRHLLQLFEWQMTSKQIMGTLKAADHALIDADQVLMMQVWTNLLSNAIKHSAVGGVIIIEVSSDDQQCTVSISDTGEGIDKAELTYVFDRFYVGEHKSNSTSTGLGLSIAQKIVDLHKGSIHISSQKSVGTVAIVTIPQQQA